MITQLFTTCTKPVLQTFSHIISESRRKSTQNAYLTQNVPAMLVSALFAAMLEIV